MSSGKGLEARLARLEALLFEQEHRAQFVPIQVRLAAGETEETAKARHEREHGKLNRGDVVVFIRKYADMPCKAPEADAIPQVTVEEVLASGLVLDYGEFCDITPADLDATPNIEISPAEVPGPEPGHRLDIILDRVDAPREEPPAQLDLWARPQDPQPKRRATR